MKHLLVCTYPRTNMRVVIIPMGTKMIYETFANNHYIMKLTTEDNYDCWDILKKRDPHSLKMRPYCSKTMLFT
jgi:hypothetical protein